MTIVCAGYVHAGRAPLPLAAAAASAGFDEDRSRLYVDLVLRVSLQSEHVRLQLRLEVLEQREVKLANGSRAAYPYIGPVMLRCKNRTGFVGALVLGDEVLLGAVPLEDMDAVVNPRDRSVDVNPQSPNIATGICNRAAWRRARDPDGNLITLASPPARPFPPA